MIVSGGWWLLLYGEGGSERGRERGKGSRGVGGVGEE